MNKTAKTLALITAGCAMMVPLQKEKIQTAPQEERRICEAGTIFFGTYSYRIECLGQHIGSAEVSYEPYSQESLSIARIAERKIRQIRRRLSKYSAEKNSENLVIGKFSAEITHPVVAILDGTLFRIRRYETVCEITANGLEPRLATSATSGGESIDALLFDRSEDEITYFAESEEGWSIELPDDVFRQTCDPTTIIQRLTSIPINENDKNAFIGYYPVRSGAFPVSAKLQKAGSEIRGATTLKQGIFFDSAPATLSVTYKRTARGDYKVPMQGTLEISCNGITARCVFEKFTEYAQGRR